MRWRLQAEQESNAGAECGAGCGAKRQEHGMTPEPSLLGEVDRTGCCSTPTIKIGLRPTWSRRRTGADQT